MRKLIDVSNRARLVVCWSILCFVWFTAWANPPEKYSNPDVKYPTSIDLTLSIPDRETSFTDDDKTSSLIKTKIDRKGPEKYFENFKEHITGDNKGKTSATCILCKEIVWH